MWIKVVVLKQVSVVRKAHTARRIVVEVELGIIKWLRESYGWTIDEVAKGMKTTTKTIIELESGEKKATLGQLRRMARLFKCPLAAFLLSKPLEEPPLPRDYRLLPNKNGIFDKKTILIVKRSRSLQSTSMELSLNLRYKIKPRIKRIDKSYNPHSVASEYRELFGLTWEKQSKFRNAYEMFRYLRDSLEKRFIHVFKFSMPLEDARGFTLADKSPAVIVVNSQDSIEARAFTLMHEFGHVLLNETVVDMPKGERVVDSNIEKWCDRFSASFLLPREEARNLFNEKSKNLLDTENLNDLSKKYKISKALLLRKMYDLNYISLFQFNRVLNRYNLKEKDKSKKNNIYMPPDQKCISKVGSRFVTLVADNFEKGFITYVDALDYLSIKSKNFDKVVSKA